MDFYSPKTGFYHQTHPLPRARGFFRFLQTSSTGGDNVNDPCKEGNTGGTIFALGGAYSDSTFTDNILMYSFQHGWFDVSHKIPSGPVREMAALLIP